AGQVPAGCVLAGIAPEGGCRTMADGPVWIRGICWACGPPSLGTRDWISPAYARLAAAMAYRLAKVRRAAGAFDLAELDDKYSYKELQHLETLGLARKGQAGRMARRDDLGHGGTLPTNVSGGSLGCGNVLD